MEIWNCPAISLSLFLNSDIFGMCNKVALGPSKISQQQVSSSCGNYLNNLVYLILPPDAGWQTPFLSLNFYMME